jgi:hypothetical protein
VPTGHKLELKGDLTVPDGTVLIVEDEDGLSGPGGIFASSGATLVVASALAKHAGTNTTLVPFQTFADTIGTNVAIKGNLIIGAGAPDLSSASLYVIGGKLTVNDDVSAVAIYVQGENAELVATKSIAADVTVIGDVTASEVITGALSATGKVTFSDEDQDQLSDLTAASVDSSVVIATATNGAIAVTGLLKTTGATSHVTVDGTGTLSVGSLELAGNLTTGSGANTIGDGRIDGNVVVGGATGIGSVTIGGDFTADAAVTVAAGKTLTIDPAKTIGGSAKIIASAAGATITIGSTGGGYTTIAGGVTGTDLLTARTALTGGRTGITLTPVTLANAFGTGTGLGIVIGSTTLNVATALSVKNGNDGTGSDITISGSGLSLLAAGAATVSGEDAEDINTTVFVLSLDSTILKIADADYVAGTDKYGIVTFTGLKLQHSGLIDNQTLPTISIGVKTARS